MTSAPFSFLWKQDPFFTYVFTTLHFLVWSCVVCTFPPTTEDLSLLVVLPQFHHQLPPIPLFFPARLKTTVGHVGLSFLPPLYLLVTDSVW